MGLVATPNPAAPAATVDVEGYALAARTKYRLWRDDPKYGRVGVSTNTGRTTRAGTFKVGISLSGYVGTQTIGCELYQSGGWKLVATTTVEAQTTTPPPTPTCTVTVPAGGNIQTAVQNAPNGSTVCLTPGATYVLTTIEPGQQSSPGLNFVGKTNLTIDGKGATIKTSLPGGQVWSGQQELMFLRGCSDMTIRDLTLVGSHDDPGTYYSDGREFQAGIGVTQGSKRITLERVVVRSNMGDGFGVYGDSEYVTIRDCESHGNGRMGVAVTQGKHVLVTSTLATRLAWTDQAWYVFEVEPDSGGHVEDVIFERQTIGGAGRHLFGVNIVGTCTDIVCRDNRVLAGPNMGICSTVSEPKDGRRNARITFTGNVGEQPFNWDPVGPGSGWTARGVLLIKDCDTYTITGNTQPVSAGSGMYGVVNNGSTGGTVSGNSFPGAVAEVKP